MSGRAAALAWAICAVMAVPSTVLVLGPGRPVPDDLFGGSAARRSSPRLLSQTTGRSASRVVEPNRVALLPHWPGYRRDDFGLKNANYALHAASEPLAGARAGLVLPRPVRGGGRPARPRAAPVPGRPPPSPRWRPAAAILSCSASRSCWSARYAPARLMSRSQRPRTRSACRGRAVHGRRGHPRLGSGGGRHRDWGRLAAGPAASRQGSSASSSSRAGCRRTGGRGDGPGHDHLVRAWRATVG